VEYLLLEQRVFELSLLGLLLAPILLLTTYSEPHELGLLGIELLQHALARGYLLALLGQLLGDVPLVLLQLRVHARPVHLYQSCLLLVSRGHGLGLVALLLRLSHP
jgi:hypothetical protein